jgi:hypothetical protein
LLDFLSLLEVKVLVQPNKVDFDVRKVLKRKKVSRDWKTSSEHGEFCIKRSGLEPAFGFVRLFPAKITPLLRTPRTASHYFE